MDNQTIKGGIIGAAIVGAVVGINKFIKSQKEISATEYVRFNPVSCSSSHPFYQVWTNIPRNLESMQNMCMHFRKAFDHSTADLRNGRRLDTTQLNEHQLALWSVACIERAVWQGIVDHPEELSEWGELDCSVRIQIDENGKMIGTNPYDNKAKDKLTSEELKEKLRYDQLIAKNRVEVRRITRAMAERMVQSALYDSLAAQPLAQVLSCSMNAEDMSTEEIKAVVKAAYLGMPKFMKETQEKVERALLHTL